MASTITTNTSTVAQVTLADAAGDGGGGQSFTTTQSGTVVTGTFYLQWIGSPSADLKISIQADSAGVPSQTDLGAVTYTAATLTTGSNGRTFTWTLTSSVAIANATLYWLCFVPAANNSPYNGTTGFQLAGSNTNFYAGGSYKRNSANNLSGTWDLGGNFDMTTTIQQDDSGGVTLATRKLLMGVGI